MENAAPFLVVFVSHQGQFIDTDFFADIAIGGISDLATTGDTHEKHKIPNFAC